MMFSISILIPYVNFLLFSLRKIKSEIANNKLIATKHCVYITDFCQCMQVYRSLSIP